VEPSTGFINIILTLCDIGLPPGNCVMLVMYSRFHNHVVEKLAAINEGGRFSLNPRLPKEAAEKKRDEDLFQTGRLVTCGQ
jgi:hypothetical protein